MVSGDFDEANNLKREMFRYQPYYCEENIYLICEALRGSHRRLQAVFISNDEGACLFHNQGSAPPRRYLIWDYHVVLLDGPHEAGEAPVASGAHAAAPPPSPQPAPRYRIFDFDTRLDFGIDAAGYLRDTFEPPAPPRFRPLFRLVSAREFLALFSTDRRHMRAAGGGAAGGGAAGEWLQPPPPWDPPRGPAAASDHELPRFVAMETEGPGVVVDLGELLAMIE